MSISKHWLEADHLHEFDKKTFYQKYVESQGIPVHDGTFVEDIRSVDVGDWARIGGKGCFLQLDGTEGLDDCFIAEIPPGGELNPDRHLYEIMVYVIKGKGATTIWGPNNEKVNFEWADGALFSIPLNSKYQLFNGSGLEPVRFLAVTNAPLMMNLIHNHEFIFNNDHFFDDRFKTINGDFSGSGVAYKGGWWETNFIPDVTSYKLLERPERGAGGQNIRFELTNNSMAAHISEFPVGTYKKGHRHGAGAHVIILGGVGYSLLWKGDGDEKRKIDWKEGSLVVPADREFHQHFNAGSVKARYLALRWGSQKYPVFPNYIDHRPTSQGGDQIEYYDEDPSVHELFVQELAKHGAESNMPGIFEKYRTGEL